jgi:hypothetical protein
MFLYVISIFIIMSMLISVMRRLFPNIRSFFKKNVKIEIVDDSVKLKKSEIKKFLEDELKEKFKNINETVKVSYEYLDKNVSELKILIENDNTRYAKTLKENISKINIPNSDNYFDAHVFTSEKLKLINGFIYESRNYKTKESLRKKVMLIRDILFNLKKIIDTNNILFYDVILEEIENQKSLISNQLLEIQIGKLTNKKVTVLD